MDMWLLLEVLSVSMLIVAKLLITSSRRGSRMAGFIITAATAVLTVPLMFYKGLFIYAGLQCFYFVMGIRGTLNNRQRRQQ